MNLFVRKVRRLIRKQLHNFRRPQLLALGALLSNQQYSFDSPHINDYEFRIFSQFGEDGIIQYLIKHLPITNHTFIEFGVDDYLESNTLFLMMNNNWSGFVMDGSDESMKALRNQNWFWRFGIENKSIFIDTENINELIRSSGLANIGLLHIDLDGNDYHILQAIDFSFVNPAILIVEYNSVFGIDRPITIPYNKSFNRTAAHFSNLYYGSSLTAINFAAEAKNYSLVACSLAGHNAFFVKNELLNSKIKKMAVEHAFKQSKFRESRNRDFSLSFLSGDSRLEQIRGLDVLNVISGQIEKL